MYDILFICGANVGRSHMAEGFYNYYAKGKKAISAATLQDVRKKYDFHPAPEVVKVMAEKGIDVSNHSIELLTEDMVKKAKKVILFCNPEECPSFLQNNSKVKHISIKDPYLNESNNSEDLIKRCRESRDEVEKIVLKLLKK